MRGAQKGTHILLDRGFPRPRAEGIKDLDVAMAVEIRLIGHKHLCGRLVDDKLFIITTANAEGADVGHAAANAALPIVNFNDAVIRLVIRLEPLERIHRGTEACRVVMIARIPLELLVCIA